MYLKGTDKKKIHKEAKHNHNTWYRVVYAQFLSRSISSRKNRSVSLFSSVAFQFFTKQNTVSFARKASSKITQEEGEICDLESPRAILNRSSPITHLSRPFVIIEIWKREATFKLSLIFTGALSALLAYCASFWHGKTCFWRLFSQKSFLSSKKCFEKLKYPFSLKSEPINLLLFLCCCRT